MRAFCCEEGEKKIKEAGIVWVGQARRWMTDGRVQGFVISCHGSAEYYSHAFGTASVMCDKATNINISQPGAEALYITLFI